MNIKKELFNQCSILIENRIASTEKAITELQASANEETKSSAGDKYETGRSMIQLEIEKLSSLLAENFKARQALNFINPEIKTETIQLGSVAFTDNGNFFISINAGQLKANNKIFFAVSMASPIGKSLSGKKTKESFNLNGKNYRIKEIY